MAVDMVLAKIIGERMAKSVLGLARKRGVSKDMAVIQERVYADEHDYGESTVSPQLPSRKVQIKVDSDSSQLKEQSRLSNIS